MDSSSTAIINNITKVASSTVTVFISSVPSKNTGTNYVNLTVILSGFFAFLLAAANFQQVCHFLFSFWTTIRVWLTNKLPSQKVLISLTDNNKKLLIFVRDLFLQQGNLPLSRDGVNGLYRQVQNINEVWPRVEGIGLSKILNVLGQNDKTKQIEIIEMSKDTGLWNKNLIILGAQAQKCFDFYNRMINVAYEMNGRDIIKKNNGRIIPRSQGYGYGIILKCRNPYVANNEGYGFLIGGFGTLGTEAASHYFSENLALLGKTFGKSCFGIVVKASITAGAQSVERIKRYDIKFKS
jgi:hypothetical protein